MNYFEFYGGDYLRDTTRLSLLDHGAFLRLLIAYYAEEQPLPGPHADLYTIAGATSAADKAAVRKVADKYFPVGPDGLRHNGRADEEIAKAADRMEGADEKKANVAERKRRSRERREAMFQALRAVGVVPEFNASMDDLRALILSHLSRQQAVTLGVTERDIGRDVTRDGTATRPQTPDPSTKASGPTHITGQAPGVGSPAGHAAAALNRAGCRVTSQNPELIAACAEGVTTQHLLELRAQFPDKPAGYLIATARREHAAQAKPINGGTHATDQRPGRLSAAERVERNIRARHEPRRDDGDAIDVDFEPVPG